MKNVTRIGSVVVLSALVALPLSASAQDAKKKKKADRDGRSAQVNAIMKKLEGAELSVEQSAKVKELAKTYQTETAELRKQLGPAARKAAQARKEAAEAGKKGKDLREAVLAILDDEQKKAWVELQAKTAEFRGAVAAVLTVEQQEKTGIKPGRKAAARKKNKQNAS